MHSGNSVSYNISEFLNKTDAELLGEIKDENLQTQAWQNQINGLRTTLKGMTGQIVFEYAIPGLSKVCDVILLLNDQIFVLEYKNGASKFEKHDKEQTLGYALRIKYFHSESKSQEVIPILVATEVPNADVPILREENKQPQDGIYPLILTNSALLKDRITEFCGPSTQELKWHASWIKDGVFKASPSIIEAAKDIWNRQNVKGLNDQDSTQRSREIRFEAEKSITEIISRANAMKRKALVFVTGVPGAGKTLIGLRISVANQKYGASLLSGNGPLVEVLTAALRKNLDAQAKNLKDEIKKELSQNNLNSSSMNTLKDKIAVDSIIRGVYAHKNEIIARLDYANPIENEKGLEYKLKEGAPKSSQHVVIYDEAQRAWSVNKMRKPRRSKKDWQNDDWSFSEPALLLWDMDKLDWGVFICLVGGGQEINEGESGINEWLRCLNEDIDKVDIEKWDVYIAQEKDLAGKEYALVNEEDCSFAHYIGKLREARPNLIKEDPKLHLTECQRSPLSAKLSGFINKLVDGEATSTDYDEIKSGYTIALTRSLSTAKKYLRKRQKELQPLLIPFNSEQGNIEKSEYKNNDKESHLVRTGLLISSGGLRLRPLGLEVKKVGAYTKTANWFLDTKEENIDSSDFLEVALDEFFVQGLEIDLSCVVWDADFRYDPQLKDWRFYNFNKHQWSEKKLIKESGRTQKSINDKRLKNIKTRITQAYMRNAYRVLLTRARLGMVICVPEGDTDDLTRQPKFYDDTYEYLKSLGLKVLDN